MQAILLRVGIDTGTDGDLAPIFENSKFEFIPISEQYRSRKRGQLDVVQSKEEMTYKNTPGRNTGQLFSTYLCKKIGNRTIHNDPEFETYTYGDPTSKKNYLKCLKRDDLLVFYAGLKCFQTQKHAGLYIIGYFTIEETIDFNQKTKQEIIDYCKKYPKNAHVRRSRDNNKWLLVVGQRDRSKLLDKAVLISQPKCDSIGRTYYVTSREMKELLGISESIQRSIHPKVITQEQNFKNLQHILGM